MVVGWIEHICIAPTVLGDNRRANTEGITIHWRDGNELAEYVMMAERAGTI